MPAHTRLISSVRSFRFAVIPLLLVACAVLTTIPASTAEEESPFAGLYEIRQSSESGRGFHVALAVRILNQTGLSLKGMLIRLDDPPSSYTSGFEFFLPSLDAHGEATVEGEIDVSREEYLRWEQGGSPLLSLEFVGESGEIERYSVALVPGLVEKQSRRAPGAGVGGQRLPLPALSSASSTVIETVVGGGPDGIPATSANLNFPYALAVDAQDNVYVTAKDQLKVLKIDAQGIITVAAGTGVYSYGDVSGVHGRDANIGNPQGLAVDTNGNAYVGLGRVYRIDKNTGILVKVAGGGNLNADGVQATDAYLTRTEGLAVDHSGNIYISDQGVIRRVDGSTGIITRFVGDGNYAYSGDGGPARNARINSPANLAVDRAGNLFIADYLNGRIRRVDVVTGIITTVAGGGSGWDGVPATSARLIGPHGVEVDSQGNLYIASGAVGGGSAVRYVNAVSGIISTVAGGGTGGVGGQATQAFLKGTVKDVALDSSGNLLIAEDHSTNGGRIYRVDAVSHIITTLAGDGSVSFGGDGHQGVGASLWAPAGVAVDARDDLLISDTRNGRVRRRSAATGTIQTVAGGFYSGGSGDGGPATMAWIENPSRISTDSSGNYFVIDEWSGAIRRVDALSGIITTVGGSFRSGGLAVDREGVLFFSATYSDQVMRKDLRTGQQTVYAGGGYPFGGLGDGGQAVAARLSRPAGLSFDPLGNLLIADKGNRRIRRVDKTTGIITTLLGGGVSWGENVLAGNVGLSEPVAAGYDDSGGLLVLEFVPPRLRRLDPVTGLITTIAGTGDKGFAGDGGPPTSAMLSEVAAFTLDRSGNIYIADTRNDRIRRIRFPLDADRDGLADEDESRLGTNPNDPDSDGDGLLDGFEAGYGMNPLIAGEQSLDPDADGLDNLSEQQLKTNPTNADSEGDGLPDGEEVHVTGTHPLSPDTDADSILDGADNCGLVRNSSQADLIHPNGIGDACDDADGDGDMDESDNCPDVANPAQEDIVHRGNKVGDACDDPDGDGVADVRDNCPDAGNSSQTDTDGDGIADGCDVCPTVANPNQVEHLACLEAIQDGGRCLESQISVNLGQREGEIQVIVDTTFVPQSITFEVNASSCDVLEPVELTLNGVVVGTFIEQIPTCACAPPRQQVVFDDPVLMNQLWRLDGNNLLGARKTALTPPGTFAGTFVGWIKATTSSSGFSLETCLLDINGGDCTEPDQCRGGWILDSFSQETNQPAPLQGYIVHSSAILAGAGLPTSLPIDTVPDGPARLCVSAEGEPVLYGSSGDGQLFRVNPMTSTGRPIGMLPFADGEIEYDDLGQRAFVQSLNGWTRQQFDIRTGQGLGSPSTTSRKITALEYVGPRLYAIESSSSSTYPFFSWLYQFEPTIKFIGQTGAGTLWGLAWDATRGRMFASGYTTNFTPTLFSISLQSGIASSIATLPFQALSLELGPDGMLYAGGNSDVPGGLYRIDPDTGATTLVGSTGYPYLIGLTLASPAYRDCIPFLKQGEQTLTINGAPCGSPPRALAGADVTAECVSPAGGPVRLDGSASTDLDSTAGTQDDIVSYEWFEEFGTTRQVLLGVGVQVDLTLPLGTHDITLRITDRTGQTGVDSAEARVLDRTAPVMTLSIDTPYLWPPNHRMVPVEAAVASSDLCGPSHAVLESIASSEPDDADGVGDGSTLMDIQAAMPGEEDFAFLLRAERDGSARGRIYAITYRSADGEGNISSLRAHVTVPHDLGGVTDAMEISVEETAAGTLISWNDVAGAIFYNAVRGNLSEARETAHDINLGPLTCIGAAVRLTDTRGLEDSEVPSPGKAFFYLAEYNQGLNSSFGEEQAGKPRVASSGGCL